MALFCFDDFLTLKERCRSNILITKSGEVKVITEYCWYYCAHSSHNFSYFHSFLLLLLLLLHSAGWFWCLSADKWKWKTILCCWHTLLEYVSFFYHIWAYFKYNWQVTKCSSYILFKQWHLRWLKCLDTTHSQISGMFAAINEMNNSITTSKYYACVGWFQERGLPSAWTCERPSAILLTAGYGSHVPHCVWPPSTNT